MRIISGKFRRKTIFPPKNFRARPTTDMAKESLFNVIENLVDIEAIKVLDLFSGTGSITYEFASRGCSNITCVELNYTHYSFIKKCVQELKIEDQVTVVKSNTFVFIKHIKQQYDLIFADPPYDLEALDTIPGEIFSNGLLKPGGILIFEHSEKHNFSHHPNFTEHKKYGAVNFSFFENRE